MKKQISNSHFWKAVGMKVVDAKDCKCTLELHVKEENLNAYNKVHGGVIASLIDSSIGYAAHNNIPDGYGTNTAQLSVYYLRSVNPGEVIRASAELIHCGKTTIMGNCRVFDARGETIAHGSATLIVLSIRDKNDQKS